MSATTMYAPPQARLREVSGEGRLIRHEKAIRAIGDLYLLLASGSLVFAPIMLISSVHPSAAAHGTDWTGGLMAAAIFAALAALYGWIGFGLRRFDKSARSVAGLACLFGLLGFPIGTLISAYVLYLLYGKKGKRVFAAEYRDVMASDPYDHAKVSPAIAALGALFIGAALLSAGVMLFGR